MHELQRVLEREIRQLAGSIFGQPQGSALDGSAEADASVGLDGHTNACSHAKRGMAYYGATQSHPV